MVRKRSLSGAQKFLLITGAFLLIAVGIDSIVMRATHLSTTQRPSAAVEAPAPPAVWCQHTEDHDCLADACASGKRVILLFSAKWCGWCRHLKEKIFPDPEVRVLLSHFALIEVDSEAYPEFVMRHGVDRYPTWIIIEAKCDKIVDRFTGATRTPEAFVKRFAKYLTR